MTLFLLLLACAPSLRIPPPAVPPTPRSEVPEGARAAYLHAAVIREQGDPERAQIALARARALDPDSPWLALEAERLQRAADALDAADRTPTSPGPARGLDALLARGERRLQAQDAAGALDDLGAALVLGERDRAPGLLVEAAQISGRLGGALGWLARAEPQDLPVLQATLLLARAAGDRHLEAETLRALRGLDPAAARAPTAVVRGAPDPTPLVDEGRALLASGERERALALALQAVDRAPASAEAWRLLASVLTAQQRFADAALAEQRAARYAGAGSGVE